MFTFTSQENRYKEIVEIQRAMFSDVRRREVYVQLYYHFERVLRIIRYIIHPEVHEDKQQQHLIPLALLEGLKQKYSLPNILYAVLTFIFNYQTSSLDNYNKQQTYKYWLSHHENQLILILQSFCNIAMDKPNENEGFLIDLFNKMLKMMLHRLNLLKASSNELLVISLKSVSNEHQYSFDISFPDNNSQADLHFSFQKNTGKIPMDRKLVDMMENVEIQMSKVKVTKQNIMQFVSQFFFKFASISHLHSIKHNYPQSQKSQHDSSTSKSIERPSITRTIAYIQDFALEVSFDHYDKAHKTSNYRVKVIFRQQNLIYMPLQDYLYKLNETVIKLANTKRIDSYIVIHNGVYRVYLEQVLGKGSYGTVHNGEQLQLYCIKDVQAEEQKALINKKKGSTAKGAVGNIEQNNSEQDELNQQDVNKNMPNSEEQGREGPQQRKEEKGNNRSQMVKEKVIKEGVIRLQFYLKQRSVALKHLNLCEEQYIAKGFKIPMKGEHLILQLISNISHKEQIKNIIRSLGYHTLPNIIGIQHIAPMLEHFSTINYKIFQKIMPEKRILILNNTKQIKEKMNIIVFEKGMHSLADKKYQEDLSRSEHLQKQMLVIAKSLLKGLSFLHYEIVKLYPYELKRYFKIQNDYEMNKEINASQFSFEDHGIYHRDIKPSNIIVNLSKNGSINRLLLIDFGMSIIANVKKASLTTNCGSVYYMAPEVKKGELYNEKIDIWSLGVIVYEMVTTSRLYPRNEAYIINNINGQIQKHINERFPESKAMKNDNQLQQGQRHVYSEWRELLLNALTVNAASRKSSRYLMQILDNQVIQLQYHQLASQLREYTGSTKFVVQRARSNCKRRQLGKLSVMPVYREKGMQDLIKQIFLCTSIDWNQIVVNFYNVKDLLSDTTMEQVVKCQLMAIIVSYLAAQHHLQQYRLIRSYNAIKIMVIESKDAKLAEKYMKKDGKDRKIIGIKVSNMISSDRVQQDNNVKEFEICKLTNYIKLVYKKKKPRISLICERPSINGQFHDGKRIEFNKNIYSFGYNIPVAYQTGKAILLEPLLFRSSYDSLTNTISDVSQPNEPYLILFEVEWDILIYRRSEEKAWEKNDNILSMMRELLQICEMVKTNKQFAIRIEEQESGHESLTDVYFISKVAISDTLTIKVDRSQVIRLISHYNIYNDELKNIIMQLLSTQHSTGIQFQYHQLYQLAIYQLSNDSQQYSALQTSLHSYMESPLKMQKELLLLIAEIEQMIHNSSMNRGGRIGQRLLRTFLRESEEMTKDWFQNIKKRVIGKSGDLELMEKEQITEAWNGLRLLRKIERLQLLLGELIKMGVRLSNQETISCNLRVTKEFMKLILI